MNPSQLWLHAQDLPKIKLIKIPGTPEAPHLAEDLQVVEDQESFFSVDVRTVGSQCPGRYTCGHMDRTSWTQKIIFQKRKGTDRNWGEV